MAEMPKGGWAVPQWLPSSPYPEPLTSFPSRVWGWFIPEHCPQIRAKGISVGGMGFSLVGRFCCGFYDVFAIAPLPNVATLVTFWPRHRAGHCESLGI